MELQINVFWDFFTKLAQHFVKTIYVFSYLFPGLLNP